MMRILPTITAILLASASFAEEVGSNNDNKGNTGLGDVGAYNYQGSDNTNTNDSHNQTNSNNTTEYTTQTTNQTTVNNGAQRPNGYVTGVPVIASPQTCGISEGGGVSIAGAGLSHGKVKIDAGCEARANSTLEHNQRMQTVKMLTDMGLTATAISLMCQVESTRIAMKKTLSAEQYKDLCKSYEVAN